jgi:hypothetical protein
MTAIRLRNLTGIDPVNDAYQIQISGDPTTGNGCVAGIGTIATRIDSPGWGNTYVKTGAAATAWQLLVDPNNPTFVNATLTGYLFESAANAITAFAGGGQASATQLAAEVNRITTVATAGDSVKLPASVAGLTILLINQGANPAQVFGLGADTIDGQLAATGVSQMQNSVVLYICAVAGVWQTEGLATGFSGSFQTQSATDNLVALAGGAQAGTPIKSMINRFITVATAADSAQLPVSAPGIGPITVVNAAAVNSMNVFPQTGDAINALAANAAFAVAAGKTATFTCTSAGRWHSVLSA